MMTSTASITCPIMTWFIAPAKTIPYASTTIAIDN